MKYIILFTSVACFSVPRDSRDLRIIHYHLNEPHLQRQDAFRIPRSHSLPHIAETSNDTIIEIPHNASEATVIETVHSDHKKEKKQSCCSKNKAVIWVAGITTGGVICGSVLSTIVALVIHFA